MLERGELLDMEECMEMLNRFLTEWYDKRIHRGLKEGCEPVPRPIEVWNTVPRCTIAAPPREYAAMLLMKPDRAHVSTQGIIKFNTLYAAPELAVYAHQWVGLRWDVEDVTKLYVYDSKTGEKICEAYSAELLQFGERISQAALNELHSRKKAQLREVRDILSEKNAAYETRIEPSVSAAVGKLDLMIGHAPQAKVVALPQDKEFRAELAAASLRRKSSGSAFLGKKADDALTRLRAMNE